MTTRTQNFENVKLFFCSFYRYFFSLEIKLIYRACHHRRWLRWHGVTVVNDFFSENVGVVNNYADTRFSRIYGYLRHFFDSSYLTQINKYRNVLILLNNYFDPGGAKLDLFRPAEWNPRSHRPAENKSSHFDKLFQFSFSLWILLFQRHYAMDVTKWMQCDSWPSIPLSLSLLCKKMWTLFDCYH